MRNTPRIPLYRGTNGFAFLRQAPTQEKSREPAGRTFTDNSSGTAKLWRALCRSGRNGNNAALRGGATGQRAGPFRGLSQPDGIASVLLGERCAGLAVA